MVKKFEDYINDFNFKVDLNDEVGGIVQPENKSNFDISTFGEYRKGATKYGGLVNKMMDWLRLQKEQSKKELNNLQVTFDNFVSQTNIQIKDLEQFIKDKISKGLYNFEIQIDYNNKIIYFKDLTKRSNQMLSEN